MDGVAPAQAPEHGPPQPGSCRRIHPQKVLLQKGPPIVAAQRQGQKACPSAQGIAHRIGGDEGIVGGPDDHRGIGHNSAHFRNGFPCLDGLGGQHRHLRNGPAALGGFHKGLRLPELGFIGDEMQHILRLGMDPVLHNDPRPLFQLHPSSPPVPFISVYPLVPAAPDRYSMSSGKPPWG